MVILFFFNKLVVITYKIKNKNKTAYLVTGDAVGCEIKACL